ncbi:MAG: DMT family transporter [Tateyamaria sp.]|nr:DMT family transporter [Tateyamaria sp.]MBT5301274.1 DMT family transporter [Tateyamaria sp.]MBT7801998.1 DMT family transporter [Tateyamaria sp.]
MNNITKAAFWMSGSIASFSSMAVAGREIGNAVNDSLDTFEIMMFRSLVGVLIICGIAGATGAWQRITTKRLKTHFIRNLAHFTGQNLWFYAVTVIPLAQVFALEFTSPIWVIVLSPLLLGERITHARVIAAALGFIGILIIARPNMTGMSPGVMTAAASAIFFALTNILTKRLTRYEDVISILFWLTTMQLVMGTMMAGYDGEIALPTATTLPWVILIGVAGVIAHYSLTSALAIAPATVVVPIDFIRLPTIAVIAMLVYGELIDVWVFIGAVLIFAGNYFNIWVETKSSIRN